MSLAFREPSQDDCETINAWFIDPELSRRLNSYVPFIDWIRLTKKLTGRSGYVCCEGARLIGVFDLERYPDQTASFAYFIDPALRGQGYGRDMLRAFLSSPLMAGIVSLSGGCETDNEASIRCLVACGFLPSSNTPDADGFVNYVYRPS